MKPGKTAQPGTFIFVCSAKLASRLRHAVSMSASKKVFFFKVLFAFFF